MTNVKYIVSYIQRRKASEIVVGLWFKSVSYFPTTGSSDMRSLRCHSQVIIVAYGDIIMISSSLVDGY